jgi:hypothetical protein
MARVRRNRISGQFAARLIEMLESPAFRALSLSAHMSLARIEIEFAHHGGRPELNGKLTVTFNDLEEYGISRRMIAPALRELEALGFIEITEKGCAGNAGYRRANKFRLTYRPCGIAPGDGSHEWRRIQTIDEAHLIAERARAKHEPSQRPRRSRPAPHRNNHPFEGKLHVA